MTEELDRLSPGGDEGTFISPKGVAARDYLEGRDDVRIDVEHTALISLHLQKSTVHLTGVTCEMMDRVATVLKGARQAGIPIIHQTTSFREGYPEISDRNKTLRNLKKTGVLQPGMESAEIHAKAAPLPGEVVVDGRRSAIFSETDMGAILRAKDITTLVFLGISTGGTINASMASAADRDYELVMLEDCCTDRDEELHRVLFQKLFPRRATVLTAQEFLQVIGAA